MMTNSRACGRARVVRRALRCARREKAHVATCVQDAPNKILFLCNLIIISISHHLLFLVQFLIVVCVVQ